MNSNDIKRLNECVLDDHALVEIYQRFETPESIEVRNKINQALDRQETFNIKDILDAPYSEHIDQIKITDAMNLSYLISFCIEYGFDSQSLFCTDDGTNYYTIFIDPMSSKIIQIYVNEDKTFVHANTQERNLLRFFEYIKKNHAEFWSNFMKLISDKSLYEFSVSFPMIERD